MQGTWQFIAARLLQAKEPAAHTPADDWESFFHVLSWVVLRFTRHGLDPSLLTAELATTYDFSYMRGDKDYGGENKESRIIMRFMSTKAQIPPGPLLDLLKDLVDVFAVRYEVEPSEEEKKAYDLRLQSLPRDPSGEPLMHLVAGDFVKSFYDRKEKLTASWMLGRFKDAVNSATWDLGLNGQRFENPLVHTD